MTSALRDIEEGDAAFIREVLQHFSVWRARLAERQSADRADECLAGALVFLRNSLEKALRRATEAAEEAQKGIATLDMLIPPSRRHPFEDSEAAPLPASKRKSRLASVFLELLDRSEMEMDVFAVLRDIFREKGGDAEEMVPLRPIPELIASHKSAALSKCPKLVLPPFCPSSPKSVEVLRASVG